MSSSTPRAGYDDSADAIGSYAGWYLGAAVIAAALAAAFALWFIYHP